MSLAPYQMTHPHKLASWLHNKNRQTSQKLLQPTHCAWLLCRTNAAPNRPGHAGQVRGGSHGTVSAACACLDRHERSHSASLDAQAYSVRLDAWVARAAVAAGPPLEEINHKNYYDKVENAATPLVVIDFYTEWCGPCKLILPKLVEMNSQMDDVRLPHLCASTLQPVVMTSCFDDVRQQARVTLQPVMVG